MGAAAGAGLMTSVLLFTLISSRLEAHAVFAAILDKGPAEWGLLPQPIRVLMRDEIGSAFRAAFMTVAALAGRHESSLLRP